MDNNNFKEQLLLAIYSQEKQGVYYSALERVTFISIYFGMITVALSLSNGGIFNNSSILTYLWLITFLGILFVIKSDYVSRERESRARKIVSENCLSNYIEWDKKGIKKIIYYCFPIGTIIIILLIISFIIISVFLYKALTWKICCLKLLFLILSILLALGSLIVSILSKRKPKRQAA